MEDLIKKLESEIRLQEALGKNQAINEQDWLKVVARNAYIKGLEKALELAKIALDDERTD